METRERSGPTVLTPSHFTGQTHPASTCQLGGYAVYQERLIFSISQLFYTGEKGSSGLLGFPGMPGLPGVPGVNGFKGAPGAAGGIGSPGVLGLQGQKGEKQLKDSASCAAEGFWRPLGDVCIYLMFSSGCRVLFL